MENPGLTQYLIDYLTKNLQRQEQQKQNQATPVFSYGEIMKTQLHKDRRAKQQINAKENPEKKVIPMMLPVSAFGKKKIPNNNFKK
jgi:predicted ATP-binding protein involved in virulence